MKRSFAYDRSVEPAAPIVSVGVSSPTATASGLRLAMLVDTGADCTCIPEDVASSLVLPVVDRAVIAGIGGATRRVSIHAATLEVAGARFIARVVSLGEEAILGRDVLERFVARFDGPRQRVRFARSSPRAR